MKIIPMFDRVVLRNKGQETGSNGLIIPKSDADRVHEMEVVAVGTDVQSLHVGDVVLIQRFYGIEFSGLFLIKEIDVLAKLGNER